MKNGMRRLPPSSGPTNTCSNFPRLTRWRRSFRRQGSALFHQNPRASRRRPVLEIDVVPALQLQHRTRVVRARNLQSDLFQDPPNLAHLFGARFRELTFANPKAVLEANADIASHQCGLRGNVHLVPTCSEHRPVVLITKEPIGGTLHVQDILWMRADSTADSEHR